MLEKFIKEVVSLLVGKQAEPLVDLLDNKKYINEFLIAKKLNLTINQTRNILYKIADYGLVSSIRKKDKRKGWYTYFWKIETLKSLEYLREMLLKKIENLNNQIKSRESKTFYVCSVCHVEYNEENALIRDFTCPECGEIFVKADNSKVLKELKKEDEKFKKQLELIDHELGKEKEIIDKKRTKDRNKAEKEKKEKRRSAFLLRKKEKEKLNKKIGRAHAKKMRKRAERKAKKKGKTKKKFSGKKKKKRR